MSGSLRSILEGLLHDCNYMLVRSSDNTSGIEKIIIVNCARGAAPSPLRAQDQVPNTPQHQILGAGQLDQLVAPIALYADPLLAQILMASTYPLEVAQADRFAKANKNFKEDKLKEVLAKRDWDASVKELVSTPNVLSMMSDKLDWTEKLGDAVLAQQADVMDAIQRLRAKAQANGKLETTEQQTVMVSQESSQQIIEIEPASPDAVYVPYYDPAVVYGEWPYPEYPPYYYPPPAGYIVGGAIATGIAWGVAYASRGAPRMARSARPPPPRDCRRGPGTRHPRRGSLNVFNAREAYRHVADLSVYVERAWRGRGVGRRVLDCLVERATALDYHKLVLSAFPFNAAGIALYERVGFRTVVGVPRAGPARREVGGHHRHGEAAPVRPLLP